MISANASPCRTVQTLADRLTASCRAIDPTSTDEAIELAHAADVVEGETNKPTTEGTQGVPAEISGGKKSGRARVPELRKNSFWRSLLRIGAAAPTYFQRLTWR